MENLLGFLGIILFTIIIHELGHLIVSLLCGVKVNEFCIGFGKPKLSIKLWDIKWSITPWVIGGYTDITGMDDYKENGFLIQPYWKKVFILCAGVFANSLVVLGIYLFYYKSITFGLWVDWELIKASISHDYKIIYIIFADINISFTIILLSTVNLISVIVNLFPFPALDGGYLWLVWLKNPKLINLISKIGFWVLMIVQLILLILLIYFIWK